LSECLFFVYRNNYRFRQYILSEVIELIIILSRKFFQRAGCVLFALIVAGSVVFAGGRAIKSEIASVSADGNWGLSFQQEGKAPVANVTAEYLAQYNGVYAEQTDEKVLYLTFDAGYENGYTAAILDVLKKHKAPAAFFLVGNYLETSPQLVKRMVDEGHIVGNHTYTHPDMSEISSKESFEKQLISLEEKYREVTGCEMKKYYRPPQGKYSEDNLKMAHELGYKTVFWSLAYVDWYESDQPSRAEAFDKLIPRVHPGAVVLLHSTSKTNAEILDELLTRWEDMGYIFKSLDEL